MRRCENRNCNKPLRFFRRSKRCLTCNMSLCRNCFIREPTNIGKFHLRGYCIYCYLILASNPELFSAPTVSTARFPIPSKAEVISTQYDNLRKNHISAIFKSPFTDFTKSKSIGKGTFAKVYTVENCESQSKFALKAIHEKRTTQSDAICNVIIEFYFSALVECCNIVSSYALYYCSPKYFILQELMWGTLLEFITLEKHINETVIAYIIRESLQGLEFLHDRHIIHRDIKTNNIFISLEGRVKIGDFGYSAQLTQERSNRKTFVGALFWMPPEIFGNRTYGVSADI